MRLARITSPVEEAAARLRDLDKRREQHSTGLPVALAGGYGAKQRSQSHEDVLTLIEAVLGRPPTMSELKSAGMFGDHGGNAA